MSPRILVSCLCFGLARAIRSSGSENSRGTGRLPVAVLPLGTRFYSCQQHEPNPQRPLWTFLGFQYFGYCLTVERAAEMMAEDGWAGPPEDIGKHLPRAAYAKVWEAVRPCHLVMMDGRNSSVLRARFGPKAEFQNAEVLDMPQEQRAALGRDRERTGRELQESDGWVACDAGLDVAVFHGVSSNDETKCLRQVEPDRLPTASEVAAQQKALDEAPSCYRFTT